MPGTVSAIYNAPNHIEAWYLGYTSYVNLWICKLYTLIASVYTLKHVREKIVITTQVNCCHTSPLRSVQFINALNASIYQVVVQKLCQAINDNKKLGNVDLVYKEHECLTSNLTFGKKIAIFHYASERWGTTLRTQNNHKCKTLLVEMKTSSVLIHNLFSVVAYFSLMNNFATQVQSKGYCYTQKTNPGQKRASVKIRVNLPAKVLDLLRRLEWLTFLTSSFYILYSSNLSSVFQCSRQIIYVES